MNGDILRIMGKRSATSLQWRHNDNDGVSNHQPHGCLLNRLFRRRTKKTAKLRVTGLCVRNSPGPVNSPHKGPVTRKMFPFDDVIMYSLLVTLTLANPSFTLVESGKWNQFGSWILTTILIFAYHVINEFLWFKLLLFKPYGHMQYIRHDAVKHRVCTIYRFLS